MRYPRVRHLPRQDHLAEDVDILWPHSPGGSSGDKVIFGSLVNIINVETDETFEYRIVGDDEADVNQGKISYKSPIARALIGKEVGDIAVVQAPSGEIEYEIDAVTYS